MSGLTSDFKGHSQKWVTIIGAGHSGCALTADLKSRGYSVCLYAHPQHSGRLQEIAARGELNSKGVINGRFCPDLATTDISVALSASQNIILALPSYAQEAMFALMAPHIVNAHRIINLNGNFSSFILDRCLDGRKPIIFETNSAPHASRASKNGDVEIVGVKKFIPIASLYKNLSDEVKCEIEGLLPCQVEWHKDIIAVSLQAYNGVLHPAPMVLNTGRVEETSQSFRFYAQGISHSVGKIVEQIDRERLEIAARYGHTELRTTLAALCGIYNEKGLHTIAEFAQQASVYQEIFAPEDMRSRYISEDVPYVLVPWYLLGQRAGYEARTMRSIIDLASAMHGTDYLETGRTLDKMNLPQLGMQGAKTGNSLSHEYHLQD